MFFLNVDTFITDSHSHGASDLHPPNHIIVYNLKSILHASMVRQKRNCTLFFRKKEEKRKEKNCQFKKECFK